MTGWSTDELLSLMRVFNSFSFKILAVVLHRLLSCCPCNPLPYQPFPLLSRHRVSPRAAPLSCWLVVAAPPSLLHRLVVELPPLSPCITASLYHALRRSLDIVVAAPPSSPPLACHHRRRGDDRSLNRRILLLLPSTSTSLMSTSSTTTSSNPPKTTVSCPIVQSNPRRWG